MMRLDHEIERQLRWLKASGKKVDVGHWQGVPTEGKPDLVTEEILNVHLIAQIPDTVEELTRLVKPNLPWTETEFLERVGGEPHNPHHSLAQWPWWRGQAAQTMSESERGLFRFSHTYSERYWPATAGDNDGTNFYHEGIRYRYGDLNDLIELLRRQPQTRQAYLPIFFPEDTGAVHGGRVPCTLGYHFLLRENRLSCWYDIRSCDAVRHFRDDVYLTCRLVQWVLNELSVTYLGRDDYDTQEVESIKFWEDVTPGTLYFNAHSLHVHAGDRHLLT